MDNRLKEILDNPVANSQQQKSDKSNKIKSLIIFWARMLGWVGASCLAPIGVFAYKFGLFKQNAVQVDSLGNVIESPSVAMNGWGILGCILIGITASQILKEVIAAYPNYSFAKQCFTGFTKTILPLLICFGVCMFLQNCIQHVTFCLGTITVCQCIAIPLNPLPKWRFEKTGNEDYSNALSFLTKFVKEIKEKEGK